MKTWHSSSLLVHTHTDCASRALADTILLPCATCAGWSGYSEEDTKKHLVARLGKVGLAQAHEIADGETTILRAAQQLVDTGECSENKDRTSHKQRIDQYSDCCSIVIVLLCGCGHGTDGTNRECAVEVAETKQHAPTGRCATRLQLQLPPNAVGLSYGITYSRIAVV